MKEKEGMADPAATQDVAVRERLLSGATRLIARKGYGATTVHEIVAAAGVTKPVLYYYFGSKEGLFLEVMRAPSEKFMALVGGSAGREGSARERIRRLTAETHALVEENLDLMRIMYAIYYGPPQGAPFVDMDVYHNAFRQAIGELVAEGIARGEFRRADVADMTWAIIGAVNITLEVELCHPELSIGAEGLSRLLDLVFEGIAARPDDPREAAR